MFSCPNGRRVVLAATIAMVFAGGSSSLTAAGRSPRVRSRTANLRVLPTPAWHAEGERSTRSGSPLH